MRAADVSLSSITLRMVPTDSDPSWHVDKVEVGDRNTFSCALPQHLSGFATPGFPSTTLR